MDTVDIKYKMMKLWKHIFHDSDAYISLIFENYFYPDLIAYHEENERLISALVGVPYIFSNGKQHLKGLYLCGLATIEEYRHRGIMENLITRINDIALEKGYHFTFLIPASDMLRKYYYDRGYINSMYRVEDRYTDIHNFENDYMSVLSKEDDRIKNIKSKYFYNLKVDSIDYNDGILLRDIVEYIKRYEESSMAYFSLVHSGKDIAILLHENKISGGDILVCKTADNIITGVIFLTFDERKRITIPKIYHDDNCSYFKLLDAAKRKYSDSPMSVKCYPEETDRRELWSKVYGASNPDGGMLGGSYGIAERVYDVNRHALPYGMSRILNFREILKILAEWRSDVKFSILVKDAEKIGSHLKCDIGNGLAQFENIVSDEIENRQDIKESTILKTREAAEILFRKKDSNSLIMDALGIPRLALNMSLMLD